MNVFKEALVPIALFFLLGIEAYSQTPADDSQPFAFKFQINQPLIYRFSLKTRTATENNIGGKTSLTGKTSVIRYDVRLTGYRKGNDGSTLVHFEPYNISEDMDIVGPNHLITQVRGLKIKSQQDGIVTIDTENNVGMGQANQIKISVYPTMLSGYLNFDPTGRTLKIEGNLPFIDYWTDVLKTKMGFFCIFFPKHPIGIQEAWTESLSMTSSSGATLDYPLTITNTFTRGLNLTNNGNPMATFNMTSADHLQNIGGYFEQNGQKSSLNFSQFNHNAFGTFHFDQKHGVLLDAKTTDTGDISLEMLMQGSSATSHINITMDMQIDLITNMITEPVVSK